MGFRDRRCLPREHGACRGLGVDIIALTAQPSPAAIRPVDLDHCHSHLGQVARQPSPVGAGSFDPDLVDGAEGLEPGQQLAVALACHRERTCAEAPHRNRTHRHAHVEIEVGVDPPVTPLTAPALSSQSSRPCPLHAHDGQSGWVDRTATTRRSEGPYEVTPDQPCPDGNRTTDLAQDTPEASITTRVRPAARTGTPATSRAFTVWLSQPNSTVTSFTERLLLPNLPVIE